MSNFYTEISKYYDEIFPTGSAQISLIQELAGEAPKDILDVACGTGGYSLGLKEAGYNITAIDLDEGMIEGLKQKDPAIDVHVLNMLDIEQLNKKFDVIFCIGNSLVHLDNNEEIGKFFAICKKCLKPQGKILLQIVNYDRVLIKNIESLPLIKNDKVPLTFERYYEYLEHTHKINFKSILKVDGQELENQVYLHPIQYCDIYELLDNLGYTDIEFYGSFKKDRFDSLESLPLIVTAKVE
ncbi:hypothetical protein BHU72_07585 [Desulfuribacillus stibiiarsenatis]|uniref:Methyltransferase domain-containing protein n=1 Tax=Desulfuribacillus stibiiarsenatis TaxID=1390249 RepID=A0A1E5L3J1_9FIRM|nr:class I SAM-dependent methyltransferase [Desulfuribacillus stibiiarsenatis]OEH84692.1 hypothetical protein BHU72_07585 [Desulfuribacillus stibiiarsenatis]